jgi:hypothetical protein
MNVDLNPTIKIFSGGSINYPSGSSIVYRRASRKGNPEFSFKYESNGRSVYLKDVVAHDSFNIVPVESNFKYLIYAHSESVPEVQLSIPRLREDEIEILAGFHELGHADAIGKLHKMLLKAQELDDPKGTLESYLSNSFASKYILGKKKISSRAWLPSLSGTPGEQMRETYLFFERHYGCEKFETIQELHSWWFAFKEVKKNRLLENYSKKKLKDFAQSNLGCYGLKLDLIRNL